MRKWLPVVLGAVAVGVGVGLYLCLTRKKTVVVTRQNQKGTVEVSEGVSVTGGRAPVCYETSPGNYYCDSGFKPGDQVVITTSDGRVLTGVVVAVPMETAAPVREVG